jgi:hypothetical protein
MEVKCGPKELTLTRESLNPSFQQAGTVQCPISFIVHLPVANGMPSQPLSFTDISISFLTPGSSIIHEFQISTYPFANSPRKLVVGLCFNVPKDTDSLDFGDYGTIGRGMIN